MNSAAFLLLSSNSAPPTAPGLRDRARHRPKWNPEEYEFDPQTLKVEWAQGPGSAAAEAEPAAAEGAGAAAARPKAGACQVCGKDLREFKEYLQVGGEVEKE